MIFMLLAFLMLVAVVASLMWSFDRFARRVDAWSKLSVEHTSALEQRAELHSQLLDQLADRVHRLEGGPIEYPSDTCIATWYDLDLAERHEDTQLVNELLGRTA